MRSVEIQQTRTSCVRCPEKFSCGVRPLKSQTSLQGHGNGSILIYHGSPGIDRLDKGMTDIESRENQALQLASMVHALQTRQVANTRPTHADTENRLDGSRTAKVRRRPHAKVEPGGIKSVDGVKRAIHEKLLVGHLDLS